MADEEALDLPDLPDVPDIDIGPEDLGPDEPELPDPCAAVPGEPCTVLGQRSCLDAVTWRECVDVSGCLVWGEGESCDDGAPCTADGCHPATGQCLHQLSSGCLIAGVCVDAGGASPAAPCMTCQPTVSTSTYSPAGPETGCNDGDPCTDPDSCLVGVCVGDPIDCADTLGCTADGCDPLTGACTHELTTGCVIGGVCVAEGAEVPGDPCRGCHHLVDPAAWSPANEGGACDDALACTIGDACSAGKCVGTPLVCDDGFDCTIDTCDPATGLCTSEIGSGCKIDGQCVGAGVLNGANPCEVCDPTADELGWSPSPPSTPCDDDDACTTGDHCVDGTCGGTSIDCDDELACTKDTCIPGVGTCTYEVVSGCLIDGVCHPADGASADDGCLECDPATSRFEWSQAPIGKGCDDGEACTLDDACTLDGCHGTPMFCPASHACTVGSCTPETGLCTEEVVAGCLIGGTCYAEGTLRPGAPCQFCQHAETPWAWSPRPTGSTCDDGNACTQEDACGPTGCLGSVLSCDDVNPCTVDGCDPGSGCTHDALADGEICSAADVCEGGWSCLAGVCVKIDAPLDCDDGDPCTLDACEEPAGCANQVMSDGSACMVGQVCKASVCGPCDGFAALQIGAALGPGQGAFQRVAIKDQIAYAITSNNGLHVIDVASPAAPQVIAHKSDLNGGGGLDIVVDGDLAYVAAGESGLLVLSIAAPNSPQQWAAYHPVPGVSITTLDAVGVWVILGAVPATGSWGEGVHTVSVLNPSAPFSVGSYAIEGGVTRVVSNAGYVYAASPSGAIHVLRFEADGSLSGFGIITGDALVRDLAVDGGRLYAARETGLEILVVSTSSFASHLVAAAEGLDAHQVVVAGSTAYAVGDGLLQLLDVAALPSPGSAPKALTAFAAVALNGAADGDVTGVAVAGDTVVTAATYGGVSVIDVGDPAAPALLAAVHEPNRLHDLALRDDVVFGAADLEGVAAFAVSASAAPVFLEALPLPGRAVRLRAVESYLFVLVTDEGGAEVHVVDASAGATMVDIASVAVGPDARSLAADLGGVYLANGDAGFQVLRLVDPLALEPAGALALGAPAIDVALDGLLACAALLDGGMAVIDASDPDAPEWVGTYEAVGAAGDAWVAQAVACAAGRAYLLGRTDASASGSPTGFQEELRVLDLADPTTPVLLGQLALGSPLWSTAPLFDGRIHLAGHLLALPAEPPAWSSTLLLDVTDATHPHVLAYAKTMAASLAVAASAHQLVACEGAAVGLRSFKPVCP